MTEPELESELKTQHGVPGKSNNRETPMRRSTGLKFIVLFVFLELTRGLAAKEANPPICIVDGRLLMQAGEENGASSIRTEWPTEPSPAAAWPRTSDSKSPSQIGPPLGAPFVCMPPKEGRTAYDISSSPEQISHLRQKSTNGNDGHEFEVQSWAPSSNHNTCTQKETVK